MKKSAVNYWCLLFIFITIADVAGIIAGADTIHRLAKPLLMPALLLMFIFSSAIRVGRPLIIAGLIFSWLGDVLLLFEDKNPLFFIGGLCSFLITHIFYILYFIKIKSAQTSLIRRQPWLAALVMAYGVSLVQFLFPFLGDLKIPVMLYAAVICTMMLCSLHVYKKLNTPSNILFISGALLFTISDSMLAINKFHQPFPGAAMLIMLSYCAAQFCIVQGAITRKQLVVAG